VIWEVDCEIRQENLFLFFHTPHSNFLPHSFMLDLKLQKFYYVFAMGGFFHGGGSI